jgi:hypothetical protein
MECQRVLHMHPLPRAPNKPKEIMDTASSKNYEKLQLISSAAGVFALGQKGPSNPRKNGNQA